MTHVFNFSAGPAMLPIEVLKQAQQELRNWHGLGTSIMEISHRSKEFLKLAQESEQDIRDLLQIPQNYRVLFCHGGARAQFAAVPMNLLKKNDQNVDYINGGYWSNSAILEAKKYCKPNIINVLYKKNGIYCVELMCNWQLSDNSIYIHYCPNETIEGIAIHELPNFGNRVIVADCSSSILSCPLDINRFGIIYAGAQKNIGPAGLTIVIIREDLLGVARQELPSILNYKLLSDYHSMFNTPPTFAWYLSGLVFKWLKSKGGLIQINKHNLIKANLLYNTIDNSDFYKNNVSKINRSYMNVTFTLFDSNLDSLFLKESFDAGLHALQGHRILGGMRASLYNAMPLTGVKMLIDFMKFFEKKYG